MTSSSRGGEPSADAIASIITQVPQSGAPAGSSRPARPIKASQAKKKKKKAGITGASSGPATTAADPGISQHGSEEEKRAHATEAGVAAAAEQAGTAPTTESAGAGDATLVDSSAGGTEAVPSLPKDPSASPTGATLGANQAGDSTPSKTSAAFPNNAPSTTSTSTTGKPIAPLAQKAEPSSSLASPPTAQKPKPKKPRRKFLDRLLPCFRPTGHEDDDEKATAGSKKGQPPTAIEMQSRGAPATTGTTAPGKDAANGARPQQQLSSSTPPSQPSTPGLSGRPSKNGRRSRGGTPAASDVAPTPVKDTTTAAGAAAAAAAANAGGGGAELPEDETAGVLSGAVVPPGKEGTTPSKKRASSHALAAAGAADDSEGESSTGGVGQREEGSDEDDEDRSEEGEEEDDEDEEDEEDRIVAMGGMGIPVDEDGNPRPLLMELEAKLEGRKCLVLDLDETLVHSSFKMIHQADFIVPVEIENSVHNVYVIKRPGVDQFMKRMGEIYEVVVFTASLSKYADPVLDMLDIHRVVKHRLFRESCYNHKGNYVKDLSQLGRPIGSTIIIDNSPASYIFHPNNAVPVSSWFNDPHDTELTDLVSFLADVAQVPDVRAVLDPRLS